MSSSGPDAPATSEPTTEATEVAPPGTKPTEVPETTAVPAPAAVPEPAAATPPAAAMEPTAVAEATAVPEAAAAPVEEKAAEGPPGQPLNEGDAVSSGVAALAVEGEVAAEPEQAKEHAALSEDHGEHHEKHHEGTTVAVVAVDAGPFCVAAFRSAARMLDKARTHYHIVHVRPTAGEALLAPISDGFTRYEHQEEMKLQRESKAVLDKFEKLAKQKGLWHTMVELKAKRGDPREAICKYCTEKKARLLVVGSRGAGPAQRILMGSVSTYFAQNAPCSIMIDHGHDQH